MAVAGGEANAPGSAFQRDRTWALAVALVSSLLYASSFSPDVAGGDAPESVAGVSSVGVLHAPGYPAYVLLARAFTWLVPFGDLAARVNLFSAVCAVGAVVMAFCVGRRLALPQAAAAFGALVLATGTSFWFYATFAKFYALTSLLLLGCIHLVLGWIDDGRLWRMAVAGAALGLATGASYQVAALVVPGLVLAVWLSGRPRRWVAQATAAGGGAMLATSLWIFVLVRAGQDPAVNWGDARTFDRLVDLVSMRDFGWGSASLDSVGGNEARLDLDGVGSLSTQVGRYVVLFTREFSVFHVALAAIGAFATRQRTSRAAAWMLASIFVVNIAGALATIGLPTPHGFERGIRFGGFLLAASFVLSLWAAFGAWVVADRIGATLTGWAQRRPKRDRKAAVVRARRLAPVVCGVVAAALLLVPALVHHEVADHPSKGVIVAYTGDVFSSIDPRGVLLVDGAEATFAFQYAQVVRGERPDVDVLAADALIAPWYRDQTERRLALEISDARSTVERVESLMEGLGDRPVFLDHATARALEDTVASHPEGLVHRVVAERADAEVDTETQEALLGDLSAPSFLADVGERWPYTAINATYVAAHLALAQAHFEHDDLDGARRQLQLALHLDPDNRLALNNLEALER